MRHFASRILCRTVLMPDSIFWDLKTNNEKCQLCVAISSNMSAEHFLNHPSPRHYHQAALMYTPFSLRQAAVTKQNDLPSQHNNMD